MKIYRFEKSEDRRVTCIKNGAVYISQPEMFNDVEERMRINITSIGNRILLVLSMSAPPLLKGCTLPDYLGDRA